MISESWVAIATLNRVSALGIRQAVETQCEGPRMSQFFGVSFSFYVSLMEREN